MGRLLHLRAKQTVGDARSMERLLDTLAEVRRTNIARSTQKRGVRVTTQLEEVDPEVADLLQPLGISV